MTNIETEKSEIVGVPSDFHMSTKDRLFLVADVIELNPENYDQGVWSYSRSQGAMPISDHAGDFSCRTYACVAGWAVHCSPKDEMLAGEDSWVDAGARQLGLSHTLAAYLFDEGCRGDMPQALRLIAMLPEPRTLVEADKVLHIGLALSFSPDGDDWNIPDGAEWDWFDLDEVTATERLALTGDFDRGSVTV